MARSQRLRLRDVRGIYRLIGECQERWADPLAWRSCMFAGLCDLTGAHVAIGGELVGCFGEPGSRILQVVYVGMDDAGRRRHEHYLAEAGYRTRDPAFQAFLRQHRRVTTRSHEQLIDPLEWRRSVLFNDYFRPFDLDDRLISFARVPAADGTTLSNGITLYRPVGAEPFGDRERRLVQLFHHELAPMLEARLATCRDRGPHHLPPRLAQVLTRLLAGESEKVIAARLHLSRATVNQYVGMIYRRFGVASRAELMAYFLNRRPAPDEPG